MKNVVKLSEYRKKKRRDAERGQRLVQSPLWLAAGMFALAVAVVFVYLLLKGGTP